MLEQTRIFLESQNEWQVSLVEAWVYFKSTTSATMQLFVFEVVDKKIFLPKMCATFHTHRLNYTLRLINPDSAMCTFTVV